MNQQLINDHIFETIIIGGGPAGLTAGLYLSRSRIDVLLLEKGIPGGQANLTEMIENYPGFPEGILGPELMQLFEKQARKFGLKIKNDTASDLLRNDDEEKLFQVRTDSERIFSKSIIIASGALPRQLEVPGEKEFTGRGVSYCAICDGSFFRGKKIIVVGGGNSAIEEALYLTKFASKVNVVHRRDELRAVKILQERAFANPKINFIWNSIVLAINGNKKVEAVQLKNIKSEQEKIFPCQGVFVFTGYSPTYPSLGSFQKQLIDEYGYILTDKNMMTKVGGIFACGDVRAKLLRQVVTACGEGAIASFFVEKYLESISGVKHKIKKNY